VQEIVAALEKKGLLRRLPGKSRNLRLAERLTANWRGIPIVGHVAAGSPITAIENHEGRLAVDASLARGEGVFALRVKGDSMIGAGILNGDYAIVRAQATVRNGEIGLVLVDDEEATIKRVFRRGAQVELRAENDAYPPLIVAAQRVRIQGKVIGIQRVID
jgi:repressor LexA